MLAGLQTRLERKKQNCEFWQLIEQTIYSQSVSESCSGPDTVQGGGEYSNRPDGKSSWSQIGT